MLDAPSATAGDAGRSLGIGQAVAMAVRHNPKLAAASIAVVSGDEGILAASGIDDFLWDASAGWARSRNAIVPGTPVQQTHSDELLLSTALTRPLATGGALGLRLSADLSQVDYLSDLGDGSGRLAPSTVDTRLTSLSLFGSHPLLRGAGTNTARAQRRRARAARDIAGLQREAVAAGLVRDVVVACWNTLLTAEETEIRRALTDSARQQLQAVQAGIGVGKQPPSAAAEVAVAVALRQDDAIVGEDAARAASIELARLLGGGVDEPAAETKIVDPLDPAAIDRDWSFENAVAAAMERNPELALARARGQAATIDVEVGENGLLPQLDLAASGGIRGNADNFGGALGQLGGGRSYDVQVGLVFQEPIGRRSAKGSLGVARAERTRAKLSEADITAQVRSAVLRQVGLIKTAGRRIGALSETVTAATLDLDAERARFLVGRATNFDVLRRQEELAQARIHVLHAKVDYWCATASLEALTGEILGHYGVVVQ
ncbi:MAG: outer membrane protein [Myxococcales bacterium]|jgi:outer membrane protein TolC|nr:outer membrane protein [Myxococcales bacterium]